MKNYMIFIFCLLSIAAQGQTNQTSIIYREYHPIIYGQNSVIFGNQLGIKLGLNAKVFGNTYLGGVLYNVNQKAKNVPEVYRNELRDDNYFKAGIQAGQLFHTGSKNVKFMLTVNPYYGKRTYIDDLKVTYHPGSSGFNFNTGSFFFDLFTQIVTSHGPSNSFEYNVYSVKYLGCAVRPELLITFGKGFGCSLGAGIDYSKEKTSLSGEIGIIYGILKYKKTKTQNQF